MGSPSLLASTSSLSRRLWGILSLSVALASALTVTTVPQPSFDLDGLGHVALAGDFNAISVYEYLGQPGSSAFSNGSESLLSQLPNGVFTSLASADAAIQALCVHQLKDGTVKGIFVGGNFTSLGNVPVTGVALFNPLDGKVTALDGLVKVGKVQALLCDRETNTVYVGGDFMGSNSSNAIAWVDGVGWTDLPFDGFDAPVKTITKSPNDTIVFGGTFNNLVNASSPRIKHAQTVNLVSTSITAEQTTDLSQFDDPAAIVCPAGKGRQWLLRDGQRGSWTANFKFLFRPTKLRIRNANFEGCGTRLFRFTAFPMNGIMNLTYTDPATNTSMHCDAWCPLSATAEFEDFFFVNEVAMNSIRVDILDFYGASGGLAGIELFQDDIYSFASTDLNEPSCGGVPAKSSSAVTGRWFETKGLDADSEYLSTYLSMDQPGPASVVFEPHIQQSGEYVVLMYTPGCRQDSSCTARGQVNVTGTYTRNGDPQPAPPYYQTNDFAKYDTVYRGFVDAADDTFRPRVTLAPATNQPSPVVNIVAQKVQFLMITNSTPIGTSEDGSDSGSLELNGLYEFDPKQTDTPKASDVAKSVISTAGSRLRTGAKVKAVVSKDSTVYVAGEFSAKDDSFQHIFTIGPSGVASVTQGGLDAPVNSLLLQGDLLYVGGQFQNTNSSSTTGLGFVASYNTKTREWGGLGSGVNGRVKELVHISLNLTRGARDGIAVSGDFTMIKADGANSGAVDVEGFAVWIPSEKQWLERMSNESISLGGILSASINVPNSNILYSGSMSSQTDAAPGAVSLRSKNGLDVQAFPIQLVSNQEGRANRKRAVVPSGFTGAVAGVFYLNDGKNYTILGGHFSAQGNDGTVNNVVIIDNKSTNNSVTGIGNSLDASSLVLSMVIIDQFLFIGGSITGKVGNNDIGGLAVWDMSTMSFPNGSQPIRLQGSANGVEVHAITRRPSNKREIYVAGKFDQAGSLPCPSLCIFDNNAKQWEAPGIDVSGQINVLYWADINTLLVGGDMNINNTATYLAIYDAKASSWRAFKGDITNIPGPVTSIAVNADTIDSIFISGTSANGGAAYVMKLKSDGKFQALTGLGDNTVIRSVQVLELQDGNDSNDFLEDNQVLLVMGSLNLPNFGNVSAATFNGTDWKPLFLTTTTGNRPGTIASLFSQRQQKFSPGGKKLAKGFVILISLAIALGLVFLLVCLGVLASYIRRRREGYVPMPTTPSPGGQSPDMQERLPPSHLFSSIGQNSGRAGVPVV
ncbi:unnamed protein product [Tuber melanosporum]|uniref:(Perigord truffle) hypothetical protein n=1 Tax=Tuber melanosporum (strain Mel28) TaxID=656061 RepID=D5GIU6_TUBMM|nr:uncharacterized protein GSTUM_00008693001 [Tuber melanosporum]CAZ84439.1 unnamed protein product [Tuber melanosporum]